MRVLFVLLFLLTLAGYSLGAQSTVGGRAERARADLDAAARDYKASLKKLLAFQESDVKVAEESLEKRKALFAQHLIDEREVEEARRSLLVSKERVVQTRKQIAESDALIQEASQTVKPASPIVRDPSPPNAEVIPLDPSDAQYLKDAISEMWSNSLAVSIGQGKVEQAKQKSGAILKRYCKCTDAEYRDWQAGQGLPSVIHCMDEATLSKRDSALIADYQQQIRFGADYIKKHNDLVESTAGLIEKRVEMRFEERHPEGTRLIDYRSDFENLRWVKLGNDEKPVSIHNALITYFGAYLNGLTEQIRVASEKLRKEPRHRNTRKNKRSSN